MHIFRRSVITRNKNLKGAGGVDGCVGEDAAASDAIRAIGADDNGGLKLTGIGCDQNRTGARFESADGDAFADLDAGYPNLAGEPGIEFIPADDAQGVRLVKGDDQSVPGKVEMRLGGVHVRDLGDVEAQASKDDLCIGGQAAAAELLARVVSLLQDKDARDQVRSQLRNMKRGGKAGGPAAKNEDVRGHAGIVIRVAEEAPPPSPHHGRSSRGN